jgi:IPT/TIG domain/Bacterial TSP3 repeat
METRARIRTLLRRAGTSAALAAVLVPAAAGTASAAHHKHHRHHSKLPVVTSVRPLNVSIGQTLTIRGRNFRRGVDKNTVAFKRTGARVVFVKARIATTKMLKVVLPDKLATVLKASNGAIVPTRLQIRVLSRKFGKRFTRRGLSPLVSPRRPPHLTPAVTAASGDCDGDGIKNSVDTDDDNDLLPDTVEARLGTDPCNPDTDGDGVTDGYEYQSALDLNNDQYGGHLSVTPAPVKRPYPNPLFADAGTDYDGDGLTMATEYKLWAAYRNPATGLNHLIYSDGNQYSAYLSDGHGGPGALVGPDPVAKYRGFESWAQSAGFWNIDVRGSLVKLDDLNRDGTESSTWGNDGNGHFFDVAETRWWDTDNNGKLSDDERDEDGDGLSNWDETTGQMQPSWWTGCYTQEKAYPVTFAGTDPTNPDSDGDGIRDGADDQDHDGIPNLQEISRNAASGFAVQGRCKPASGEQPNTAPAEAYVNPFNPCLPFADSRTCERHPAFNNLPAGLDPEAKLYVLN